MVAGKWLLKVKITLIGNGGLNRVLDNLLQTKSVF